MDDSEYIPVKPNINNYAKFNQKQKKVESTQDNIFSNNKDSDIQEYINKKNIDAKTLDSVITKEERDAKSANTSVKNNEGSSWIIIILAIIVIVLILVIIYYVINYNNLSVGEIIPESVIKPTYPVQAINMPTQNYNMPTKPRNFVDPTKKDLNDALNKLTSIEEEEEGVKVKKVKKKLKKKAKKAKLKKIKILKIKKFWTNSHYQKICLSCN